MSESLLFAILGFLVACLLGTVFASFLWRRAVSVTTRKMTDDENFADLGEVADLRADLRAAQNNLANKDREMSDVEAKVAELETSLIDAKAAGEGAAENLKQELQNAGKALEAAHRDRDAAKEAMTAKSDELAKAQDRVTELENAIRTLVKETALMDAQPPKSAPTTASVPPLSSEKTEEKPAASPQSNEDGAKSETAAAAPPLANAKPATSTSPGIASSNENEKEEPAEAVSRSLEERIEALKQGETPSA